LGIGTATPGAPLDIHSTGTNAQFNGTGTNNAYLVFQNAGTSKWRIGNLYNAGANSFEIYDVLNATTILTILNTGATTLNGALSGTSFTGTSFVKSGGTSAEILAADGSVITAGTNITISGGTISSSGSGISGTGTTNTLPKFTGTSAIGNSNITDTGSLITLGSSSVITGSTTAASAIARGVNITSTLVASANSDVLVALDINPTFTNGAFTGVSNYAARIIGNVLFGTNFYWDNANARLGIGTTTPTSTIDIGTNSIRAGSLNNFSGGTLSLGGFGTTIATFSNTAVVFTGGLKITSATTNQTTLELVLRASQIVPYLQIGTIANTGDVLKINSNGNIGINQTTDAGIFKVQRSTFNVQHTQHTKVFLYLSLVYTTSS
jgi:3D (Asp-Asp-Asp) domain-containing protein